VELGDFGLKGKTGSYGDGKRSAVGLTSVGHAVNDHPVVVVVHRVQHPIITNPKPKASTSLQLSATDRARVRFQGKDCFADTTVDVGR